MTIHKKIFISDWEKILENNIPIYNFLPSSLQSKLKDLILIFLDDKRFFGCDGLEITDEIRITISAQACLLIINRKGKTYPLLSSILIYPDSINKKVERIENQFVVTDMRRSWLGDSNARKGQIRISWKHAQLGALNWKDGQNLVLHEFAHQLDQEDSCADGVPILNCLNPQHAYMTWNKIITDEYKRLQSAVENNMVTVIDEYGATDLAEFFAVATEVFFEKPIPMKLNHSKLYKILSDFYGLDPAEWSYFSQ
ncbi:M90 family metallopeptidase [Acaryochloris marina]|uniref:Zinc-dependent peptidase n=1 Tax=Acaryochloris marina (strain MBIC 11017) TaxID=329726 RepID=A8ZLR3_ACAM1|nr:M90 family metallopeptidase [Acaryochloris marina]ABW32090.1 conserved hypothetical protein [Acaryochloris marina MBIC11017]